METQINYSYLTCKACKWGRRFNLLNVMHDCGRRYNACQLARDSDTTVAASNLSLHGPLSRYVKLWVAHTPEMPGTFSPSPWVSDPDMHHGACVTHVPWCMPGSLASSFLWSRWRGKRSRHYRRMRNPQFYVFGKRPIAMRYLWTRAR